MISEPSSASGITQPGCSWVLELDATLHLLSSSTGGRISFIRGDGTPITRIANHVVASGRLVIGHQRDEVISDALGQRVTYVAGQFADDAHGAWRVTVTGTARSLDDSALIDAFAAIPPHNRWSRVDAFIDMQDVTIAGHLVASARS